MSQSYTKNLETDKYVLFLTSEFSQWFPSDFTAEGKQFHYAEQYMMYQKAMLFGDHETAQKILEAETPDEQKKLGRLVKNFDVDVWNAHAEEIVYQGNYHKFTQNPHLFKVLAATKGKELVEAAHYDKIWGIGLKADDPLAADKANWRGTNWLGGALTKLREALFAAGFQPAYTEENRYMFRVHDKEGQRNLYVSGKELSAQSGGKPIAEIVSDLECYPVRDAEYADIEIKVKGLDKPLQVNMLVFMKDNSEVMARVALDNMKDNPFVKRYYKPGY